MKDGSGPAYTRRGRQALFPLEKVIAWEAEATFTSLAHERAAEVHRKRGEQKEKSVTACLLADLAGTGGRSS
jgi:hypothetical protein